MFNVVNSSHRRTCAYPNNVSKYCFEEHKLHTFLVWKLSYDTQIFVTLLSYILSCTHSVWNPKTEARITQRRIYNLVIILPYTNNTIRSFHWFVPNATIPCRSQKLLPFLYVIYPFPSTLFHQLVCHPTSLHLAICFFVYLSSLVASEFIYNTFLGNSVFFHSLYMPKPMQSI
jgi:hypothetical protein